ncbi:precorrin-2 oxidase [Methanocella sp. CWC-04]|uniref:precorrin-2 dehydrogenase n=1 Tax=Methanooceanicella nereidis TaxID=2052831 RepID=A0AAP2W7C2_9EURY|nr:bifunctional precorrin-2 dehydrogenase/sirohydrochlorin ferrochelatase [Methanocella sp. CWC-04]MCD1296262.1 precorrin-2 oxidase [Methanocella sp. CWC-04]
MGTIIPLFIDLEGRNIIVFGGGGVGERKARLFSAGNVRVISAHFTQGLEKMGQDGIIKLERRSIVPEDVPGIIGGAFLVIAATSDKALNDDIKNIAEKSGVMVNNATGESGIIVPSVLTRGDITIGISTGGKSPGMSRYIRETLEDVINEDHAAMVRLQDSVRESLKSMVPDQKERERLLWKILEDREIWDALSVSYDKALDMAMELIKGSLRSGRT